MIQWQFSGNTWQLPQDETVAMCGNPQADKIIGNMLFISSPGMMSQNVSK